METREVQAFKIFALECSQAGNFARNTSQETLRALEQAITNMRHDGMMLKRLHALLVMRQELPLKVSAIQSKLGYLVNEIDSGRYDVVCDCCPKAS